MQTPQEPEPPPGRPQPDQPYQAPPPGWPGQYPARAQEPYSPAPQPLGWDPRSTPPQAPTAARPASEGQPTYQPGRQPATSGPTALGGPPPNQVWSPAQQYSGPQHRPAAQQYPPGGQQHPPGAPQFQPEAPQFQPGTPQFQPGAPQYQPPQFQPAQQYSPGPQHQPSFPPYGAAYPPETRRPFPSVPDQPTAQLPEQATDAAGPSRRNLLIGTGVAVVAGAAGYATFVRYGPSPATSTSQTPAGPSASGTAAAPNAANTLAKVADIPVNGGIVLAAKKIVLTRGTGDQVKAFTAVCTHQGCLVTKVSDATIQCSCHGSRFDAATGAVVSGPASSPLAQVAVKVVNGVVEEK